MAAGPAPRGSLPPPLLASAPLHQRPGLLVGPLPQAALSLPPPTSRVTACLPLPAPTASQLALPRARRADRRLGEFAGSARGPGRLCPRRRRARISCDTTRGKEAQLLPRQAGSGALRHACQRAVSMIPFPLVTQSSCQNTPRKPRLVTALEGRATSETTCSPESFRPCCVEIPSRSMFSTPCFPLNGLCDGSCCSSACQRRRNGVIAEGSPLLPLASTQPARQA